MPRLKTFSQWMIIAGAAALLCHAQSTAPRLVLIDQDGAGPGNSDQMSMMALLQSPQVRVLGITVVSGDVWRDEGVAHTLRMLEIIGREDVPVVPGAVFPLVRTKQETELAAALVGHETYLGAWAPNGPGPWDVPPLKEGAPKKKALEQDAAHFLIEQVHAHPHEVTIYAAGPMTNIALAVAIDPHFAELTRGIVLMGSSLNPVTDDPEFSSNPRHEFNFWFDPEAAHIMLHAPWPRIDVTTVDISLKTKFTQTAVDEIGRSKNPAAQYVVKYSDERGYLWDELAACAWLEPSLITKERMAYMDVDLSHGPHYGDTLTWEEKSKPANGVQLVHVQLDVDLARFMKMFVELMSAPPRR
jgi:purine nucleosidase